MKKYAILVLASVFMFSTSLLAQSKKPIQEKAGERKEIKRGEKPQLTAQKRVDFMAQKLALTDAEKAKVLALLEKQDAKQKQRQLEIKKIKEDQKAKFEADRKSQKEELEKIIGKDKVLKLDTVFAERKHKMIKKKHRIQSIVRDLVQIEHRRHGGEGHHKNGRNKEGNNRKGHNKGGGNREAIKL